MLISKHDFFHFNRRLATALIDAYNVIKMCAPAAPPIRLRIRTRAFLTRFLPGAAAPDSNDGTDVAFG